MVTAWLHRFWQGRTAGRSLASDTTHGAGGVENIPVLAPCWRYKAFKHKDKYLLADTGWI